MHFLPKILCVGALLLIAGAVVACDIETTPTINQDLADPETDAAFEETFVKDPYTIATSWFEYQSGTHAILPRAYIYRFETEDETTLFQVKSYYTPRGDSGYFTMESQRVGGEDEAPRLLELTGSIKEGPVCVGLSESVEVDCDEGLHDLVFRVEYRAVPGAGFSVSNPAIYTANHFSGSELSIISRASFESLDEAAAALDDVSAWQTFKDARTRPADGLLYATLHSLDPGEPSTAMLHASANMKLIGWTFEKVADDAFSFSANCVDFGSKPAEQSLPISADAKSASLNFDADAITLVSLCGPDGPELVEVTSSPYRALWPEPNTYDLVVDTLGDTLELRLAPGHYITSTGAEKIDATTTIPADIWD